MVGTGCVVTKFFLHPMYKCIAVRCLLYISSKVTKVLGQRRFYTKKVIFGELPHRNQATEN
jgi:predicted transcriptional regulator